MKKFLLVCLFATLLSGFIQAQELSWPAQKAPVSSVILSDSLNLQLNQVLKTSPAFLPKYVKENPSGYSYLCRLELKIEEQLPLAMWLRLGQSFGLPSTSAGQANIRFKLFRF